MKEDPITEQLGRDIEMVHERLDEAIRKRLPGMSREERERYLALLSPIVAKIEEVDKPLRAVLQEALGELLPVVMQGLAKR